MPPKKLVRRARKSLRERRMNQCLRELQTNFEKVEQRKYRHDKAKRAVSRKRRGVDVVPIPREVRAGRINEELFRVECILHARANLPPPTPLDEQIRAFNASVAAAATAASPSSTSHGEFRIGCLHVFELAQAVQRSL